MTTYLPAIGTAIIFIWVWRRRPALLVLLAPSILYVVMATLTLVFGKSLLASQTLGDPGGLIWIRGDLSRGHFLVSLAGFGMALGVWLLALLRPRVSSYELTGGLRRTVVAGISSAVPFVMILLFMLVYGLQNLVSRSSYLIEFSITQLGGIAGLLHTSAFALAVVAFYSGNRSQKLFNLITICLALGAAFALGTRLLAVFPILWFAVDSVVRHRIVWWKAGMTAGASFVGLYLALVNRSSKHGHGFVPYWNDLASNLEALVRGDDTLREAASNLFFSVPLTSVVSKTELFDAGALAISLDPRRGSAVGWPALSRELRIADFIPFNGLGQLASMSIFLLLGYCVAVGLIASAVYAVWSKRGYWVMSVAGLAIYVYFSILLLQYNLRSANRFTWVLIVLLLLAYCVPTKHAKNGTDRRSTIGTL